MQKIINFILLLCLCAYSCNHVRPCDGIECGEFGTCQSGECECFYGRTGEFCEQFSPLQLDRIVLYMDSTTMSMDWEPNQAYGWKPDVYAHIYSDNFNINGCGDFEFITEEYHNSDINDVPFLWSPNLRLNERDYTLVVQEHDELQCPQKMASFRFFIDKNSENPLIVTNNIHSDQFVELHWSWQ